MKDFNRPKFAFSIGKTVILFVFYSLFASLQIFANPGRLDLNFPQILANDVNVTAIETQPDGKILVAGEFVTRGAILRNDMIRLNTDGTLDSTFSIGTGTNQPSLIRFIKVQPDGKILIAGYITQLNGMSGGAILRLNQDGSIDTTFNLSGINVTFVHDLDIQTDGKILISASNLIGSSFVTRLKTDGSNDQGIGQSLYNNGTFDYRVTFLPAENKILVGGRSLVRLNISGGTDMTFTANITSTVFDLLINTKPLANGKVLVYGKFDMVNGITRRNVAILNSDGSLDTFFNPATLGAENILSVAAQTNGKIVIGGKNFALNSLVHGNIARLNADGSLDRTFNQGRGANDNINALKILTNNKLLLGGTFFRYHTFLRAGLTQVNL